MQLRTLTTIAMLGLAMAMGLAMANRSHAQAAVNLGIEEFGLTSRQLVEQVREPGQACSLLR